MPVTHARPRTVGMTPGNSPTVTVSTRRPVKPVPISEPCTKFSCRPSSPRAASWAIRADVPVPRGEWPVSRRREDHVAAAADLRVLWMGELQLLVHRVHDPQSGVNDLVVPVRPDLKAHGGGGKNRVEIAAERQVEGQLAEP